MSEKIIGFALNTLMGAGFIMVGIYLFFSKREKPMYFWANTKPAPIPKENVHAYNRAFSKLWIFLGIGIILVGVPLLGNNEVISLMVMVFGEILLVIALMILYIFKVESKYREK